jgi:phage FluMu gp28-like protein
VTRDVDDYTPEPLVLAPAARDGGTLPALPIGDLLLPYQSRAIRLLDTTKLLVIEKSRRIGLTWGMAAHAALTAGADEDAGGMNVWYMGTEMEMAREFVDAVAMWARAFGLAADAVGEEVVSSPVGDVQAFRVRFASGCRVTAIPSVPRALRGRQGLVIIDEAAFHKDIKETLDAAMALLIWGGKVVVISTHYGVENPFNQLIDEIKAGKREGAVVARIDFEEAMAAGLFERIMLVTKGENSPAHKVKWEAEIRSYYGAAAEQELDCIPSQNGGSLISGEMLAACEHEDAGKPELYSGGPYFMGRDVAAGRGGDMAIIWGFELVGDVLWLRDRYEANDASFREQDAAEDDLYASRRVVAERIDQTGLGEKVVEDSQGRHGATRVQGVILSGPNRLGLATCLVQRFERALIRIPPRPEIRADLRGIKRARGPAGAMRLVESGSVHPDRFWAAALACEAADTPYQALTYRPVKASNQNDGDDIRFARPDAARFRSQRGAY